MRNYDLSFISNEDLYNHTKNTVEKYRFQVDLARFNKNLIDPIKLTFDSKVYNRDFRSVIESEIVRQMDKSNTNHIGYFHQNIFNYIGDGWRVPAKGYDIVNLDEHYYVEMKNKHNTMNSSSSQKTYMRMQNTLLNNSDATCMLVEVIARNSQNIIWNIRLDGDSVSNKKIRRVSIDKFYRLVTGKKIAFKELCEQLPRVIEDIVNDVALDAKSNTVFTELEKYPLIYLKASTYYPLKSTKDLVISMSKETISESLLADIMSVSKRTVASWRKNGKVSPLKNGRYALSALDKFPQVKAMLESNGLDEPEIQPLRNYKSIELFAGAGGLAIGLEKAGFNAVALNEIDKNACATLRKNRPNWNVLEGDISHI